MAASLVCYKCGWKGVLDETSHTGKCPRCENEEFRVVRRETKPRVIVEVDYKKKSFKVYSDPLGSVYVAIIDDETTSLFDGTYHHHEKTWPDNVTREVHPSWIGRRK